MAEIEDGRRDETVRHVLFKQCTRLCDTFCLRCVEVVAEFFLKEADKINQKLVEMAALSG